MRQSGLAGWFVVVGNLRLWMRACSECGKPSIDEPLTHFTTGNIDKAQSLRNVLQGANIDTSGQWSICLECEPDIVYSEYDAHWDSSDDQDVVPMALCG